MCVENASVSCPVIFALSVDSVKPGLCSVNRISLIDSRISVITRSMRSTLVLCALSSSFALLAPGAAVPHSATVLRHATRSSIVTMKKRFEDSDERRVCARWYRNLIHDLRNNRG